MDQTEAELETFRQRWREEVNARISYKPTSSKAPGSSYNPQYEGRAAHLVQSRPNVPIGKQKQEEKWEDYEPQSYHDIEPREPGNRLGDGSSSSSHKKEEPSTALEHYEEAVRKETVGKLGDSVKLYRKAFKLDDNVHESYKAKHFPAASFPPKASSTSNTQSTSSKASNTAPNNLTGLSPSLTDLLSDFSNLKIQGSDPPTDLSPPPPCPIAKLPEEILAEIMLYTAIRDVATFARLAQVCKRMAYLVLTSDLIWKRIAQGYEFGFAAMHYRWACQVNGDPLFDSDDLRGSTSDADDDPDVNEPPLPSEPLIPRSLVPQPYPSYRALFRSRPRIRFNGCYICTVNYTRAGAAAPTHATWTTPVHIVTYYRYLRFFRNGTVISLLSTAEPAEVVHQLTWENLRPRPEKGDKTHRSRHHETPTTGSALPHTFMKEALPGRWRLSGPDDAPQAPSSPASPSSEEGTLYIETEGVPRKYDFKMNLAISSAGRGARSNKLSWLGHWSYNKTTDDWAEFGLKHDKPYYWSRVKSFGGGVGAGE